MVALLHIFTACFLLFAFTIITKAAGRGFAGGCAQSVREILTRKSGVNVIIKIIPHIGRAARTLAGILLRHLA